MRNTIREDHNEEEEEVDDVDYVSKRRSRSNKLSFGSVSTVASVKDLSEQEWLDLLEAEGFKPCIRHDIIQEEIREDMEEIIAPFTHKDEAYARTAPVNRDKKKGREEDDSHERRVDPYIMKVKETELEKEF